MSKATYLARLKCGRERDEAQVVVDSCVVHVPVGLQRCESLESECGQERTLRFSGSTGVDDQPCSTAPIGSGHIGHCLLKAQADGRTISQKLFNGGAWNLRVLI